MATRKGAKAAVKKAMPKKGNTILPTLPKTMGNANPNAACTK